MALSRKNAHRLNRLMVALIDIPQPLDEGGTQSQSTSGFLTFAKDMREYKAAHRQAVYAMAREGITGWVEGVDYENIDRSLTALEAWVKARETERWMPGSRTRFKDLYDALAEAAEAAHAT